MSSRQVRFYGDAAAIVTSVGGVILAGQGDVMRLVRATWALTQAGRRLAHRRVRQRARGRPG